MHFSILLLVLLRQRQDVAQGVSFRVSCLRGRWDSTENVFISFFYLFIKSTASPYVPQWELPADDVEVVEVNLDEECEIAEAEEVLPIPEIEIEIPVPEPEADACEEKEVYPEGWNAESIIF